MTYEVMADDFGRGYRVRSSHATLRDARLAAAMGGKWLPSDRELYIRGPKRGYKIGTVWVPAGTLVPHPTRGAVRA
jgi:hypothetical protein